MVFHVITIFPRFFEGPFDYGVVARARSNGLIGIETHDLRDHTFDRHRTVDDRPFGGDEGMVLKIEPVFLVLKKIRESQRDKRVRTVLLSAQGKRFDQSMALRFAGYKEMTLICGRYEGVDERVAEHLADEEVSVGDFVLSGGEWACGIVVDAVTRLLPGALGNEASTQQESFRPLDGGRVDILDCPHYTRPAEFEGWKTPEVLLSGNHEQIRRWRRRAALEKTWRNRPELLGTAPLSPSDREWLAALQQQDAGAEVHHDQ